MPLRANASDEKSWYPFLQNKGWYPTEGQSGSTGSTTDTGNSMVQQTTQPSGGSFVPTNTNTSSQGNTQPGKSSWFQ